MKRSWKVSHLSWFVASTLVLLSLYLPRQASAACVIAVAANWLWVEWTPASGPVLGYAVYVSRNGGEMRLEQWALSTSAVVTGPYDEVVQVKVAAFDRDWTEGPPSPLSSPFRLVQPSGDLDADGFSSALDNCPLDCNPTQQDSDLDGVGDACDGCQNAADPGQADADLDLIGDVCDPFPDDRDNEQAQCEAELDDPQAALDQCLAEPGFADEENDGEYDSTDACAQTPEDVDVDSDGCSLEQFCTSIAPNAYPTLTQGIRACALADWQNTGTRNCTYVRVNYNPPVYECVVR
jgi:hypothetical protein